MQIKLLFMLVYKFGKNLNCENLARRTKNRVQDWVYQNKNNDRGLT